MGRSKLAAMLQLRCPRCREGKMFSRPAYDLRRFDEMPVQCPVCGLYFEVEVGFYWGAMYISYGFSVALLLVVGMLVYLAGDPPVWVYMLAVGTLALLFTPVFFRFARMLMLHLFGGVAYDPHAAKAANR